MTPVRSGFIAAGRVAVGLLRAPAVAAAWGAPSALAEFSVGGLAGHLAYQILVVPRVLEAPVPTEETVSLLDHYSRVQWIGADLDDDINVRIRAGGEQEAAAGPGAVADAAEKALAGLESVLPGLPDRPVRMGLWGAWSLLLDDLLMTRTMELVVHADDLAVSAGVPTPVFEPQVVQAVVDLLSRLAVRRHGATAVVRALSRAERAPSTIAAF